MLNRNIDQCYNLQFIKKEVINMDMYQKRKMRQEKI